MGPYRVEAIEAQGQSPAKVNAAQQYLYFCNSLRFPHADFQTSGDTPTAERTLSKREQATYDAATDVLFQYFSGEMDFGDTNPGHVRPDSDDGQAPRVPVLGT